MEQAVLNRLKSLLDDRRIEPVMFFKVCALLGVSFAAAFAAAASSHAYAETSPAPSSYADLLPPETIAYIDAARTGDNPHAADDPFVKVSGEPYHAFSKAP